MGKKKNKKKDNMMLFGKDYSEDVTFEEQCRLNLIAEKLMAGENVDLDFDDKEKTKKKHPADLLIPNTECAIEEGVNQGALQDVFVRLGMTKDDEVGCQDDSDLKQLASQIEDGYVAVMNYDQPVESDEDDEDDLDDGIFGDRFQDPIFDDPDDPDDQDDDFKEDEDESEMSVTLDSKFKLIRNDSNDFGDLILNIPWDKENKIFLNIANAREFIVNYEDSKLFQQMKEMAVLAAAFIAGPILVIPGTSRELKKFISECHSFDKNRIFFVSKTDDTRKDEDGNPIVHFLVYYIDEESGNFMERYIDEYSIGSKDESEDEKVHAALDILFTLFFKACFRLDNRFADLNNLDSIIWENKSSSSEIEYVFDLIKRDKDTKLAESDFASFNELVLPIEALIPRNKEDIDTVFGMFQVLLSLFLDDEKGKDQLRFDERNIPILPDNFGFDENGQRINVEDKQEEFTIEELVSDREMVESVSLKEEQEVVIMTGSAHVAAPTKDEIVNPTVEDEKGDDEITIDEIEGDADIELPLGTVSDSGIKKLDSDDVTRPLVIETK